MIVGIVAVLILGIMAVVGGKEGLIRMVFSLGTVLVALGIAYFLAPPLGNFLMGRTGVTEGISRKTAQVLEKENDLGEEQTPEEEKQQEIIKALKLPGWIKEKLQEHNEEGTYQELGVETFRDYMIRYLARLAIRALSFLLIFLLAEACLGLVCQALDLIGKLPLLHELNHAAGFFAGILMGLLVLWVLCIGLTAFSGTSWGQSALEEISRQPILSAIYNNNLLLKLIR